jgi:hypothetical protein
MKNQSLSTPSSTPANSEEANFRGIITVELEQSMSFFFAHQKAKRIQPARRKLNP